MENKVIKNLTSYDDLVSCTSDTWKQLVDLYPYSQIIQLQYAKKLSLENSPDLDGQLQKTALHYPNLWWLRYLLNSTQVNDEIKEKASVDTSLYQDQVQTTVNEHITPNNSPEVVNEPAPIEGSVQNSSLGADTDIDAVADTATNIEDFTKEDETKILTKSVSSGYDYDKVPNENLDDLAENRLASVLRSQMAEFKKPLTEDEKLQVDTKPLFRTDYFAYQGILATNSQDNFGNKVRKFTDWLKEIKKTPGESPELNTTEEEEKIVIAKAEASLRIKEIVTESMAEVLIQQNKRAQALEVYRKLSLLYPEKSSYFADKINSLH